jgi:predicted nuclease of predicted toxin-antitoxin system
MTDERAGVGFLFDENIPAAFTEALQRVGYNVTSTQQAGLDGKDDPDVIAYCGDTRLVWVTKDLDARKKAAYAQLVREKRVSAVFLAPPRAKGWSSKEQFEVIVKHLRPLEDRYRRCRGPRFYVCRAKGQPREVTSFSARPGRA